jgi:predicted nucleotidyltransferase
MAAATLEQLFRAPGQIAVLRALWKSPTPVTGRQVQRLAGVHSRTAVLCLADLERLGICRRRAAGRAFLYSLRRQHHIVREIVAPVFRAEQAAPERFLRKLGRLQDGHCLSAVLYGSAARGDAGPASDLDLLVVVVDESGGEGFASDAQPRAERLARENWGAVLEVYLKTRAEVVKDWNTPLLKRIRHEGRLLAGDSLEAVKRAEPP